MQIQYKEEAHKLLETAQRQAQIILALAEARN